MGVEFAKERKKSEGGGGVVAVAVTLVCVSPSFRGLAEMDSFCGVCVSAQ